LVIGGSAQSEADAEVLVVRPSRYSNHNIVSEIERAHEFSASVVRAMKQQSCFVISAEIVKEIFLAVVL